MDVDIIKCICIKEYKVTIPTSNCFKIFEIGDIVKIVALSGMPNGDSIFNTINNIFNTFDCLIISEDWDISEYFMILAQYREQKMDEILK